MSLRKRAMTHLNRLKEPSVRGGRSIFVAVTVAVITSFTASRANADLFVSSFGGGLAGSVQRYDQTTGEFRGNFVSPGSGGLSGAYGMVFGPDGNLYVASSRDDSVKRYNGTTGMFIDNFVPSGSGGLVSPEPLLFGPDSRLYVGSFTDGSVKRYNGTTGTFIDNFVSPHSGGLGGTEGFIFGPDGNLYVTSGLDDSVKRYNGTTGMFIDNFVPSGSGGLSGPESLIFGLDGKLYVSNEGDDSVKRYNGTTGAFELNFVATDSGGLLDPNDLIFGPDGNLYVASGTNSIKRYKGTTGTFMDDFVSSGLSGPKFLVFFTPAPPTPTPEPHTLIPMSSGLLGLGFLRLWKWRHSPPRMCGLAPVGPDPEKLEGSFAQAKRSSHHSDAPAAAGCGLGHGAVIPPARGDESHRAGRHPRQDCVGAAGRMIGTRAPTWTPSR